MRIAIAGAGNVGRSIAQELVDNGHQVMLIERYPRMLRPDRVPGADWVLADACELSSLQEAQLQGCDVVIAATGDDKANLVVSLLAKTEFAVPRVVARVNRAENEWLFTDQWGVDVAVSKPRLMAALVEEAVTVGDLVRLMTFRQGEANLVEITLPPTAAHVGSPLREVPLPRDTALVAIVRGKRVLVPSQDDTLEAGDELVFVCTTEMEEQVRTMVLGGKSAGNTRRR
jgi:trk system potassium uptake protein TrkA